MPDKPTPEPEAIERWAAQRKAAIIVEVMKGQISVPEAARKYGFTKNKYRHWADATIRPASKRSKPIARWTTRSVGRRCDLFFRRSDVERVVAEGKGRVKKFVDF